MERSVGKRDTEHERIDIAPPESDIGGDGRGPRPIASRQIPMNAPTSHPLGHLPVGIAAVRPLPDEGLLELWESIFVPSAIKGQLLGQAVLNFTVRPRVSRVILPLHGVILLSGPPGTGKTSLAKGLATRTAESLPGSSQFRLVEVDPHALANSALGRTQRAVTSLFRDAIAEQALLGPTIVLLDEVETLLVDRSKLSLEANPVDVHRSTDAALVQLDHIAEAHPNTLFVATSNFAQAIDPAFLSRTDLALQVPLPDEEGCRAILAHVLHGLGHVFPRLATLVGAPGFSELVAACAGLDGRQIRKVVAAACAADKQTALDADRLTITDLIAAARSATRAFGQGGIRR